MIVAPPTARSRRDLVTNSAFEDLLSEVAETVRKESERLAKTSQGGELKEIHFQSGIVEGAKRAFKRMENYRKAAMEDFRSNVTQTPDMFDI